MTVGGDAAGLSAYAFPGGISVFWGPMGFVDALRSIVTFGAKDALPLPVRSGWDALELKASPGRDVPTLIAKPNDLAWQSNEVQMFVRESMRVAGIVFRGGTLIADAFAEAPLKVYEEGDGEPEEQVTHWARQLIHEPNPEQGEEEFWNTVLLIAFTNGYAWIEKVRARDGSIVQLWPRTPDAITKRKRPSGAVYYEHRVGNTTREIAPEDLFHVPYQYDAQLRRLGVTPVEVIGREIGIDVTLTSYLKLFLDESGVPPFAITTKDTIYDQAVIDQIQLGYAQKYGRGRSWGVPPVMHGGFEITKLGLDMDEMAYPDLRGITELRIAQGLGIPAHLLGAKEAIQNGGLSTTEMKEAMAFFQVYTINQLRKRVAPAFTRSLLREREPDKRIVYRFDTKEVEAMQEDEDKRHERVRLDVQAGLVTVEEARPALGYEPKPANGETYLRPFSVVEVIAGQEPEEDEDPENPPPAVPPKSERRYRDVKALSDRELSVRAAVVDRNRKAQRKLTSLLDRLLRKFWKEQADRITDQLGKSADGLSLKVAEQIAWDDEEDLLRDLLERFYAKAGEQAFADSSALLGVSIDWQLTNPNIQRTLDLLGKRIVGIAATTRQDVSRIVADGLTEGQTLEQIAASIRETMGGESYKNRAMTIALTESQTSYNLSAALSYEESGVVTECELFDNPDHTTDPGSDGLTCSERNGLVVPLSAVSKHVNAEHPRGTLAVGPVVSLGQE